MDTTTLPLATLEAARPCNEQWSVVVREWPNGIPLNDHTAQRCVALGLDVAWAAKNLLTPENFKAYNEAIGPALKALNEATATAWRAYDEARATALKAYDEAIGPALKALNEATATALKAYDEAIGPALKAYDEAIGPALVVLLTKQLAPVPAAR